MGKKMGAISIKVIAPPHYEVVTSSIGKPVGVKAIEAALERIEKTMQQFGGKFVVTSKPEIVGDEEEVLEQDLESEGSDSEEEARRPDQTSKTRSICENESVN